MATAQTASLGDLTTYREQIDGMAVPLIGQPFFRPMSMPSLSFTCPEAGFLRLVSWLYTLYAEAGRVSIAYVVGTLKPQNATAHEYCRYHLTQVQSLRTFLQHSLNVSEDRDRGLESRCRGWLEKQLGGAELASPQGWELCMGALIQEACGCLLLIVDALKSIATDEFVAVMTGQWKRQLDRNHSAYEYDRVIETTLADFGFLHIDPLRIRKTNIDKWQRSLDVLKDGYDFEFEVRKLVEQVLISETPLPVTGNMVMMHLGVAPGPDLRHILVYARQCYSDSPCSAEVLLERVYAWWAKY